MKKTSRCPIMILLAAAWVGFGALHALAEPKSNEAGQSEGRIVEVPFDSSDLPPTLYTMLTGKSRNVTMRVALPAGFDPEKTYPIVVYLRGTHGGPNGDLDVARDIVGDRDWVAVGLPLFKGELDINEIYKGLLVSMSDYSTISAAYQTMLKKVFEIVPHHDPDRSLVAGFSNGAITLSVLITCHDQFLLKNFHNFCIIDHGMFHLTDLHKIPTRSCRFMILQGDKKEYARELKQEQSELVRKEAVELKVDLSVVTMKDTGHAFPDAYRQMLARWLAREEGWKDVRAGQEADAKKG